MTRMPTIVSLGAGGAAGGAAGAAFGGVGTGEGRAVGEAACAVATEETSSKPRMRRPESRGMAALSRACPAPLAGAGWDFAGKSTSCWDLERRGGLLLFPDFSVL